MVLFSSRRDRKKHELAQDYRITAVIRTDFLSSASKQQFIKNLEQAIYETSADYPAVTHYFVRLKASEIIVGLQIEKVAPENVENIATLLLQDSIRSTTDNLNLETPPQVEESELYLV